MSVAENVFMRESLTQVLHSFNLVKWLKFRN